ncbi:MAG: serine/threonine protein phosphatase [Chitinophagaceae bacterium]|nr:serine/threonine protein phosphatase [Chitinophagaceae bacterium]
MPETFVVGDIHGALKALEQLIEILPLQNQDRLIFLGDYVDGWPESAGVLDYLMELQKHYFCTFIKGNHDIWCESWLSGEAPSPEWLQHGGLATAESYSRLDAKQIGAHLEFLDRMKLYYIDEENRLFIHAGFSSVHGPLHERYESNFTWDRTLWETALATDGRIAPDSKKYPRRLLLFKEIYIGHTPTINFDSDIPMHAASVWNIDTGAGFYGKLSAVNITTKQYFQSDIVKDLYPDAKGRGM